MSGNGRFIKRNHIIYDSDLPNEIWKSIEGYDGYEVSNLGRVKSLPKHLKNPIILHYALDKDGYHRVVIYKNKKAEKFGVHQLVAKYFVDNIHNKPHVNHIDNIKGNNNSNNLEWCTNLENQRHAWDNGFKTSFPKPTRKLNKETVDEIRALAGTMMQKEIAAKFNINFRLVSAIITKRQNRYVKW